MDVVPAPLKDRRLEKRYLILVRAHMKPACRTASAATPDPGAASIWAATQAAWRFNSNPRVTLPALVEPLREAARTALATDPAGVALAVYDWSKLSFPGHGSKRDTLPLSHPDDVGYDLATMLLVSAATGDPLAPLQVHLRTARGVQSTQGQVEDVAHVEQVLPAMRASRAWGLPKPLVHVIDRESDSVGHMRAWREEGHCFLVRADAQRRVLWQGREVLLSDVAEALAPVGPGGLMRGSPQAGRPVRHKGRPARQHVAQTRVTLHRPARRRVDGRRVQVAGEPLELRLVVSRVFDLKGKAVATWLLLTDVGEEAADAATVALWYYWRWRIESYFKLLKSHGHHVEQWQQESGAALARRLLVCAMACVLVWDLRRRKGREAQELRELLVRLSGRQMKRRVSSTAPALLAGLMVLLPILSLLEEHGGDLSHLRRLAHEALPLLGGSGDV